MITVMMLDKRANQDHVGLIPYFLDEDDPRPAREQFDEKYQGGWNPQDKIELRDRDMAILYSDDPPLMPLALIPFREERIIIYWYGYVAIIQPDGSFEACRMD